MILDALRAIGIHQPIPKTNNSVESKSFSPLDDEKNYQDLESDLLIYYNNPNSASSELKIKRNEMVVIFVLKTFHNVFLIFQIV